MATPREDKTETVSAALTNSGIDSTVKALLDAMQKQNERLTQQMSMLTLRMDEVVANTKTGNVSEASSLITVDEVTHTAKDQSVLREPRPLLQTPPQPSWERTFPEQYTQPELKAESALKCIPILNVEDDIGVEDFIHEIQEVRMMCSEPTLLLKMIKIEKIVGKAAMAIRNIRITEFESLYEALRRNVAAQVSVREQQDELRGMRQGLTESVQNYNIRFRSVFNKLQHSITNEYRDELTRRVMNEQLYMDSVTDYVRGLRPEIGQTLMVNLPPNLIEAERKAMNMERYFREHSSRRQMTRQTTAPPFYRNQASHPVDNRLAITSNTNNKTSLTQNILPRTNNFTKFGNRPLSERTQAKCPQMQSIGTPSKSMPKFSDTASKKSPSRNKPRSRTIRINNATSGRLPTILLQLPGRPGLRFLVDSGAGINLLKQRCLLPRKDNNTRHKEILHGTFRIRI